MFTIVPINEQRNDWAVYSNGAGRRGPFGTPLLFRGTLEDCLEWRRAQ